MSTPDYREDWKSFSRNQDIWPFKTCNKIFDESAVRLKSSDAWNSETLIAPPEDGFGAGDFSPEVRISINKKELLETTGLPSVGIGVAVHIQDPGLKRSFCALSSKLDSLKDESTIAISRSILDEVSISRGLYITILAYSLV